jgi:hypothetical protein
MTAGYSKTPLAKKLGIKENFSIILFNEPTHYKRLFSDFPKNTQQLTLGSGKADFIHLFLRQEKELIAEFNKYKEILKKDGLMWISWPKGSSSIPTDLKRDSIREYALANGLVDVKVAAVDENWSGLKFVYRLKDR